MVGSKSKEENKQSINRSIIRNSYINVNNDAKVGAITEMAENNDEEESEEMDDAF